MVKQKPFMSFPFNFVTPVNVIQETTEGVAIVEGTLLVEGISRNGNFYTVEEMKKIAKQTEGKPVFYGVTTKINPNTGLLGKNLHDNDESARIGRIMETLFDAVKRKITFIAEIVNTVAHPDVIHKIKSGWGISIGGFVMNAKRFYNKKLKRIVLKIKDMVVEHMQIVPPSITRGQKDAKVKSVKIQETMIFPVLPQNLDIRIVGGDKTRPSINVTGTQFGDPNNIRITLE